jgi:hypothetical protein
MYAIDVREAMRERMLGAHVLDPTVPYRVSRGARVLQAFAAIRRERAPSTAPGARRETSTAASVGCGC